MYIGVKTCFKSERRQTCFHTTVSCSVSKEAEGSMSEFMQLKRERFAIDNGFNRC